MYVYRSISGRLRRKTARGSRNKRKAIRDPVLRWNEAVVPYKFVTGHFSKAFHLLLYMYIPGPEVQRRVCGCGVGWGGMGRGRSHLAEVTWRGSAGWSVCWLVCVISCGVHYLHKFSRIAMKLHKHDRRQGHLSLTNISGQQRCMALCTCCGGGIQSCSVVAVV